MTEPLARDDVIGLLNRLGGDDDEEVLEAAREAHARITAAGLTWDDLLVLDDDADDDTGDSEDADDEAEADELEEAPEAESAEPPPKPAGTNAEALSLIDKLLAKSGISEDLREELKGYKTDIKEGEFDEADRRYVRAVYDRLTKRR